MHFELRPAFRSFAAQRGWTLAAVLCLAIGTGSSTAAFTIVNGLLLRPLPFPDPERLVMIAIQEPNRPQTRPFALTEIHDIAPALEPLATIAGRTFSPLALAGDGESRMVEAEFVSANYFDVLRVAPAVGRFFRSEADRVGGPLEAVISYGLWQRRFNGDPAVVGRALRANSHSITIGGVAPAGFVGATSIVAADLWLPAAFGGAVAGIDQETPQYGVIGRLTSATSRTQLRTQLDTVLASRARDGEPRAAAVVVDATGFGVPPVARRMLAGASALLFFVIALISAVAIANVASLMLARAADRRREIGVRLALGAGWTDIVRQMLAESVLLAVVGCGAGVALAGWLTRALTAMVPSAGQPAYVAFAIDLSPDLRVSAYAAAMALVVAVLFGLVPARLASRVDVIDALRASPGSGRRPGAARALNAIVVGQIAVSTTLLVMAGLLVRTYVNTLGVDPGIETHDRLLVSLDVDQLGIDESAGRRLYEEIQRRVSALPGVEAVSLTRERPVTASGQDVPVWTERRGGARPRTAGAFVITPGYFPALGIPLVQGRAFREGDSLRQSIAVINETMAREFWPGEPAVGRTFRAGERDGEPIGVVGVARDVRQRSLTEEPQSAFYRPFAQVYSPRMSLLVRLRDRVEDAARRIDAEIHAANGNLAIVDANTLDEQLEAALAPRRQSAVFLLAVCGLGLGLSSLGLYGVIAYGVRRRTRELGIRAALGARISDVVVMVVGDGLRLTLSGLIVGAAFSLAVTRAVAHRLYGVGVFDPATFAGTAAVLVVVTLTAAAVPARWATRVDPVVALRED